MKSSKTDYYATPNPDGTWNYKKGNAQRATGVVKTQSQAEKLAKVIVSRQGGGEVRIQGKNGNFRDSDTVKPAKDPNPPKDKKH